MNFRLVLISPPTLHPREHSILQSIGSQLHTFHLRKPNWSRGQLEGYLQSLPAGLLPRVVLHGHHDLAKAHGLKGVHLREQDRKALQRSVLQQKLAAEALAGLTRSTSLHRDSVGGLQACGVFDYVFLSPIYNSISKEGYTCAFPDTESLVKLVGSSPCPIYALGGVTARVLPEVAALGFQGAAMLGAVWEAEDPVAAFQEAAESASASTHYDEGEAIRYTTTNQSNQIQRDLTRHAVELLGLKAPYALLADVGCGSGLSGRELSAAGHTWVGLDISSAMLQLAAADHACAGRVCLADMAQGLALRGGSFDGLVSISAVQWLCALPDSAAALARLFHAMRGCLKHQACAALQVYPEDDAQAEQLLSSALRCGFHAGFFVDFPHPNPAKKYYLCLQHPGKLESVPAAPVPQPPTCTQGLAATPARASGERGRKVEGGSGAAEGANLSAGCCNLAWPKTGHEVPASTAGNGGPQQAKEASDEHPIALRLHQEHAVHARRTLRLLRRAMRTAAAVAIPGPPASGETAGAGPAAGSSSVAGAATAVSAHPAAKTESGSGTTPTTACPLLAIELEAVCPRLLPCGGTLAVHAHLHHHEFERIVAAGQAPQGDTTATPAAAVEIVIPSGDSIGGQGSTAFSAWVAGWLGPGSRVRACRVETTKLPPTVQQEQQQAGKRSVAGGQSPCPEKAKRARGEPGTDGVVEPGQGTVDLQEGRVSFEAFEVGQQQHQQQQLQQHQQEQQQHQQQQQGQMPSLAGQPLLENQQQPRGRGKGRNQMQQQRQPPSTDSFFSYRPFTTILLHPGFGSPAAGRAATTNADEPTATTPCAGGACAGSEGTEGGVRLVLGLLRQLKAPTHLVLSFHHHQEQQGLQPRQGEAQQQPQQAQHSADWQQGAWAGAGPALRAAAAAVERLCQQLNGCVVGCDLAAVGCALPGEALVSSWVVFLAEGPEAEGMQERVVQTFLRECC
ncbi:hypothetical protein N2152v2_011151 [Parachlorella kessleri]